MVYLMERYTADIHWMIVNLDKYLASWYCFTGRHMDNLSSSKMAKGVFDSNSDFDKNMDKKSDKNKSCNIS